MKDIDEFYAEKCGIYLYGEENDIWTTPAQHQCLWTIQDPRCREIIREKFKLDTLVGVRSKNLKTWICEYLSDTDGHLIHGGRGKTIAEAEIACLEAIHQQENEAEK